MLSRVAAVAGAVVGWGAAIALGVLALMGGVDDETANQLMLVSLSVALVSSARLALWKHQRPLGAAYEMGYEAGRRDAIREASGRRAWGNVSPIRRGADGSSAYERSGA